jgi:hypothetical protein
MASSLVSVGTHSTSHANEWMSLDGVVQAPGLADEDTSGGFEHGGWHVRYFDDLSEKWVSRT